MPARRSAPRPDRPPASARPNSADSPKGIVHSKVSPDRAGRVPLPGDDRSSAPPGSHRPGRAALGAGLSEWVARSAHTAQRRLLAAFPGGALPTPQPRLGDRGSPAEPRGRPRGHALIRCDQERAGVEAETRPTDGQDLQRRLALKRRDGGVDEVILLLSDTRSNRLFLRAAGDDLRRDLPVPGRENPRGPAERVMPRGSGIVLLPLRRSARYLLPGSSMKRADAPAITPAA